MNPHLIRLHKEGFQIWAASNTFDLINKVDTATSIKFKFSKKVVNQRKWIAGDETKYSGRSCEKKLIIKVIDKVGSSLPNLGYRWGLGFEQGWLPKPLCVGTLYCPDELTPFTSGLDLCGRSKTVWKGKSCLVGWIFISCLSTKYKWWFFESYKRPFGDYCLVWRIYNSQRLHLSTEARKNQQFDNCKL